MRPSTPFPSPPLSPFRLHSSSVNLLASFYVCVCVCFPSTFPHQSGVSETLGTSTEDAGQRRVGVRPAVQQDARVDHGRGTADDVHVAGHALQCLPALVGARPAVRGHRAPAGPGGDTVADGQQQEAKREREEHKLLEDVAEPRTQEEGQRHQTPEQVVERRRGRARHLRLVVRQKGQRLAQRRCRPEDPV